MKTISAQLSYFFRNKELRRNLPFLARTVGLLVAVVAIFTVLFHYLMLYEGQSHSWVTGLYWTLTVMSTLGFGDITFTSDLGRIFSVVVLMTGIVMLLIVLPFAFIRFFYAPWLKAQVQSRAPRELPAGTEDHVIICRRDPIAPGLIETLEREEVPYAIIGPDAATASEWCMEGISAVVGDVDDETTYQNLRAEEARLLVANHDDVSNTNITLTARSVSEELPIAAIANEDDAVDILEMSGANRVLPVKRWLGEQLANRVKAQKTGVQSLGRYGDLKIAEMTVRNTPLTGKTIRESRIRQQTGANVVGVWERGPLQPADPNHRLTETSVLVVMGTQTQLRQLYEDVSDGTSLEEPVVVIGGGRVGEAAIRALANEGVDVHLVERDPERCDRMRAYCAEVFVGDASNYTVVQKAGIESAPAVLLTTHDDATNVHLTSYCRNLNSESRIVSRITSERNLDAIYRAGADYVLSYATLGVRAVKSVLTGRELTVLGEGVDLFARRSPEALVGETLREAGIGAATGMSVVALKKGDETVTELSADVQIEAEMELLMIGSDEQLERFMEQFE